MRMNKVTVGSPPKSSFVLTLRVTSQEGLQACTVPGGRSLSRRPGRCPCQYG